MRNLTHFVCALLVSVNIASGAGWGSAEGQVVLDGDVPDVAPLVKKGDDTAKDAEVCAAQTVPNDEMLFDAKTGGVANVFIYMRRAADIHPDLKASKEDKVIFDQKGCRFTPHGLMVRTDQVVVCKSSDGVAHNVNIQPLFNSPSNFIVQPNDSEGMEVKMALPESLPVTVKCDIHPWMRAWWLVLDHPYAAITDAQGKFKIENLPEGDNEFRVWHPKTGYIERSYVITVKNGETTKMEPVKVSFSEFQE